MMSESERLELGTAFICRMEQDLKLFGDNPRSVYLRGNPETEMTDLRLAQMEEDLKLFDNNLELIWIMHEVNRELTKPEIELIDKERIAALGAIAAKRGADGLQLQRIMRHVMLILP